MSNKTKLGHHLEVCFSVKNLEESVNFYSQLGFRIYTGDVDKGWCSMTDGIVYIGLFPDNFIDKEFGVPFLLNYRGGNMDKITEFLDTMSLNYEKKNLLGEGLGDALISDPNGVKLYFDTTENEERIDM